MQFERFRDLVEAYGAGEGRWPESLRGAMREFARTNANAARCLEEARALDALLAAYEVPAVDLCARVLERVPASMAERLMAWLVPVEPRNWWRPALAGAVPVVFGLALGVNGLSEAFYAHGAHDWELEERALLAGLSLEVWYEYE